MQIHTSKIIPQEYFPVFARARIQAPHVFAQKLIPQYFFLHVSVLCRRVCICISILLPLSLSLSLCLCLYLSLYLCTIYIYTHICLSLSFSNSFVYLSLSLSLFRAIDRWSAQTLTKASHSTSTSKLPKNPCVLSPWFSTETPHLTHELPHFPSPAKHLQKLTMTTATWMSPWETYN